MTLAIDYAWSHPDPAAIKGDGYAGVLRYLSPDTSKNISPPEVASLRAHGLDVALVYEGGANGMAAGSGQGSSDGRLAASQARAVGYPQGCAVYAACDFDASAGQFPALAAYMDAFTAQVKAAGYASGFYGGLDAVDWILTNGHADYGWQTVAWSGGQVSQHAHLYQRIHTTTGLQGSYDEDTTLRPGGDYGQWSAGPRPAPSPGPVRPGYPMPWLGHPLPGWWRMGAGVIDIGRAAGGDLDFIRRRIGYTAFLGKPWSAQDRNAVHVWQLRNGWAPTGMPANVAPNGIVTTFVARVLGS